VDDDSVGHIGLIGRDSELGHQVGLTGILIDSDGMLQLSVQVFDSVEWPFCGHVALSVGTEIDGMLHDFELVE
jgi:hypothetical protein